jgi:hypothetical protein
MHRRPIRAAFALAAALSAGSAHAIDDRFDPARYDHGGFAPAANAEYAKECGSCHFAYLPGMLPARSWKAIMGRSEQHFGESLSLSPEVSARIANYLEENAADRSSYRGAALMLYNIGPDDVPQRITWLPLMRQRHVVVRKLLHGSSVKSLTNCDACHERAATGSFAYGEIVVPGVTKIIRPGGLF